MAVSGPADNFGGFDEDLEMEQLDTNDSVESFEDDLFPSADDSLQEDADGPGESPDVLPEEEDNQNSAVEVDGDSDESDEPSAFQKNKKLIIGGGIVVLVLAFVGLSMVPVPGAGNQNQQQSNDFEMAPVPEVQDIEQSDFGGEDAQDATGFEQVSITEAEEFNEPENVVQGLNTEEVLELISPMGEQINSIVNALNEQNEAIRVLSDNQRNQKVQGLTNEDIQMLRAVIDKGLSKTVARVEELENDINNLKRNITTLSYEIENLQVKASKEARRSMTMMTAREGKIQVRVDETGDVQTIQPGDNVRGYGVVSRVGPWGCMYFDNGEQYAPANASCAE